MRTYLGFGNLVETKTEWAFSNKLSGVTWHPENSIHFIDLSLQP